MSRGNRLNAIYSEVERLRREAADKAAESSSTTSRRLAESRGYAYKRVMDLILRHQQDPGGTTKYLSTTGIAARLGITRAAVSKYSLPEPDATIGAVRGWLPETIDRWQAQRPGQGARTDKKQPPPSSEA